MAIIYIYPLKASPLSGSDLIAISDMTASDKPTRSVTLQQVADFTAASGSSGVGQIVAGDNISITSTGPSGTGIVTINSDVSPVTYSFTNIATGNGNARLALDGSDGSSQTVTVTAGTNITITDNEEGNFVINADDAPCLTLLAGVIEDNPVITLSDGLENSCPDSTVTFVAGNNMDISRVNNVLTFSATGGSAGMTSWDLRADNGSVFAIGDQGLVDISGGVDLTTSLGTSGTDRILTINHDSFGTAGTYNNISSITTNSTGHIIGVGVSSGTNGFTPLDIAQGNASLSGQSEGTVINTYWFQTISDATLALNKAKIYLLDGLTNGFAFAIYEGNFASASLLSGKQFFQGIAPGIYEFSTVGEIQASLTLGEDYVIALSLPFPEQGNEGVLGINDAIANASLAATTGTNYVGNPWPSEINTGFFEAAEAQLTEKRPCVHIY